MRFLGSLTFPDGSTMAPLTKESVILKLGGRSLEIPFVYDGTGRHNIFIDESLYWVDDADSKRVEAASPEELSVIQEKIKIYCDRRGYRFRINPTEP